MKRLTKRSADMVWMNSQNRSDLLLEPCEMSAHDVRTVLDRLSSYEDTGLEPEAIEGIKRSFFGDVAAEIADEQGYVEISRAKEIAMAESEGRLVVLPCKAGDTVFWAERGISVCEIIKCRVDEFRVDAHGPFVVLSKEDPYMYHWNAAYTELLGRNLFLTREEAEKALEEMG